MNNKELGMEIIYFLENYFDQINITNEHKLWLVEFSALKLGLHGLCVVCADVGTDKSL